MAVTFSVKSQDGKIVSNLSVAEVKRLFDEGKINDQDMISKDGSGQWNHAYKYKGANSKNDSSRQLNKPITPASVSPSPKPENNTQEVKLSAADSAAQQKTEEVSATLSAFSEEAEIQTRSSARESKTTWIDAIEKILATSSVPLHYNEITEKIISEGLCKNIGATPSDTVQRYITASIRDDGYFSPFMRAGRGIFALNSKIIDEQMEDHEESASEEEVKGTEEQYEIITALGMFWRRESIEWNRNPKLLGMAERGATPVDFCKQLGIYLLYDGREVIYVGRSTDRPLGKRLYEHTFDRLSTRWDRFSWFGLLPVSDDGQLGVLPDFYKAENMIPALEAILIEALEPRQNRRRGDDLEAVEYIQKVDPEIEKKRIKATLDAALNRL
jgi:hypothetical protein